LVQQASASMVRINEFLDTRPAIVTEADELPEVRGAITFEHVSFTYPYTGVRALTDVSFHVPAGSTLAIVGRTGAGKSTVADLIARQYDITSGAILIDGVPIRRVALGKLRAALGIVPQDVFLFSDSIRHNIAFGSPAGEVDDDRVEAAARIAHVHDDIMGFPKGYGTVLGERGLTLSGGQKQRVSIARAIIGDPRILIFDDALSAVDTATEEGILRALRTATAGRTVIMIAHRVSTVRDADQVLVMDQGRIVERGTHDELVALGGIYAGMHAEQLLEAARHG
jgi:ATP-binding cassette subfamily B protein